MRCVFGWVQWVGEGMSWARWEWWVLMTLKFILQARSSFHVHFKFEPEEHSYVKPAQKQLDTSLNGSVNYNNASTSSVIVNNNPLTAGHHRTNVSEKVFRAESPHSVLNIESRPLLRESPIGRSSDRDDNKYKRKTPQEIFSRWSRWDEILILANFELNLLLCSF